MIGVIVISILPTMLIISILGNESYAITSSQGPRTATASGDCVNDTGTGTVAWTSPGNAFSSNTTYATASVDGTATNYIKCTNFGFSIPTGATISGITLALQRLSNSTGNGGSQDSAIRLVKGGVVGSTDRSTATLYTTSAVTENHGSTSDLWGTTWTVGDINATNFGAAVAVTKLSSAGAAHTVSVDVVQLTVTYDLSSTFTQSAYRWFENLNSANVGSPISGAAQDTAVTLSGQAIIRLRLLAHVGNTSATGGGYTFKLQYAARGADNLCDTSFTNETYADVTTSTPIAYANNVAVADGATLTSNANDPTHSSDTKINQTYEEVNNVTLPNTVAVGQDAMWDFALTENGPSPSTPYCFRLVDSAGGTLSSYSVVPELTSSPAGMTQDNYRWFRGQGAAPNNSFLQTQGGGGTDEGQDVTQTQDGGYVVVGTTASYGAGSNDIFLTKYDSTGAVSWSRTWGGANLDYGRAVIQTPDGGYAITGYTGSYGAGGYDAFLSKYDSAGTLTWNRVWGGANNDQAHSLVQTPDGGYIIAGDTLNYSAGASDAFVAKYDSSGTLSWSKTWGGTGNDYAVSIINSSDGGYALAGTTTSYGAGASDTFLAKFDNLGTLSWSRTWGDTNADTSSDLIQTTDGGYIIVGNTSSFGGTGANIILIKYDAAGTVSWSTAGEGPGPAQAVSISATSDGGFSVTGWVDTYTDGGSDAFLAKYTSSGGTQWMGVVIGISGEQFNSAVQTTDNGYIAAGSTTTYGAGANDILLAKFSPAGTLYNCGLACDATYLSPLSVSSASTSSPSASTSSPSASTSSPSASTSSPSPFVSVVAGYSTYLATHGGTGAEGVNSIAQASDGGYVVGGFTASYGAGGNDGFLVKYDSEGAVSWNKTWGGAGADIISSVFQTSDGYAVTGYTASYGAGAGDAFIAKYTSTGTLSWNTLWGGTALDKGQAIIKTADGGYAVAGNTASYTAGGDDVFLAKYNSIGTLSWSRTWGGTGSDNSYSLIQTSDGGYIIAASTDSFGAGSSDVALVKFDSSGTLSWNKTWGGTNLDYPAGGIVQTSDGGFAITGSTLSYGAGGSDAFIAKFDSSGTLSWNKTWGGAKPDGASSIMQTSDGGYAIVGESDSYSYYTVSGSDAFLAKFDGSGTLSWSKTWGGTGPVDEVGEAVLQASDEGYIVAGATSSYGAGGIDIFLAKYNSAGGIYGCPVQCTSPSASSSSPSASTSSPSASTSSPTATTSSPSASTSTPTTSYSTQITKAVWGIDGPTPNAPLAAQDTAAGSSRHDDPLRLRAILKTNATLTPGSISLKLQVAPKVGTCDATFTGETYADVGGSAAFNYYSSPGLTNNQFSLLSTNDPTPSSGTLRYGSYIQSAPFLNRQGLVNGGSELFDISLTPTDDAVYGNYCFRIVKSDNSQLVNYSRVFELSIPPATSQQLRHGQFFDEQNGAGLTPYYW